ncbi:Gamma-glutamyl phosphate reductase [Streptomyces tendae]
MTTLSPYDSMSPVTRAAYRAKSAAADLAPLPRAAKDDALLGVADALEVRTSEIVEANAQDVAKARAAGTSEAIIDRLVLTPERVRAIASDVRDVVALPDPVGEVVRGSTLPNGIDLRQVRVPLGVVGIIYEGRPNVTVDAAALCLKSGNAVLLRGSSSAYQSNTALVRVVRDAVGGAAAARRRRAAGARREPGARRSFSEDQVFSALTTAKDYIVRSALDPDVLGGKEVRSVRVLLDPDQLRQFDESFEKPASDGRHAPTGWLIRFDPARAELADPGIRVDGSLRTVESNASTLEVTADHTMVYALRPAGDARAETSLFTVRRELHFRFDRDALRLHQTQLVASYVQAGPLSCADDSANHLRPLLAGQKAGTGVPAGTDPYTSDDVAALCGSLAAGAQPKV